jgi:hypothetical protein
VRGRWLRPYLGYYLGLVEDNRCSVPENSHVLCHLVKREEELFKIDAVRFERLMTLLRQGVEGGLDDIALVEVRFVVARASTPHA